MVLIKSCNFCEVKSRSGRPVELTLDQNNISPCGPKVHSTQYTVALLVPEGLTFGLTRLQCFCKISANSLRVPKTGLLNLDNKPNIDTPILNVKNPSLPHPLGRDSSLYCFSCNAKGGQPGQFGKKSRKSTKWVKRDSIVNFRPLCCSQPYRFFFEIPAANDGSPERINIIFLLIR